jgi:hypothetical protein
MLVVFNQYLEDAFGATGLPSFGRRRRLCQEQPQADGRSVEMLVLGWEVDTAVFINSRFQFYRWHIVVLCLWVCGRVVGNHKPAF